MSAVSVQLAAVLQGNAGLLGHEGDLFGLGVEFAVLAVCMVIQDLVAQDAALKDLLAVLFLDTDQLDDLVAFLDTDQGAQLTDALTAGALDTDGMGVGVVGLEFHGYIGIIPGDIHHFVVDLLGTGGNTAGTGADQNAAGIIINGGLGGSAQLLQGFSSLNFQFPSPLSFSTSSTTDSGVIRG